MKKIFRNLFVAMGAFALAAAGMTSCNNEGDETYDTNWTVEAEYLESTEAGAPNLYSISFNDNSIEFDAQGMTTAGNGYMVTFWVNSSSMNEPAEGTYEVSETGEDNTLSPGTSVEVSGISMIAGTSVFKVTDGDYTNDDITMCEEGTLELKKDGGDWIVKASLPLVDGETLNISWKGAIAFVKAGDGTDGGDGGDGDGSEIGDPAWPYEPQTPTTLQIEFTQASAEIKQENNKTAIQFSLKSDDEEAVVVIFPSDPANPYGSYTMSGTQQGGTVLASTGGTVTDTGADVYPSYVLTGTSQGGFTNIYYLTEGSVNYTQDALQIDTKSHHGSTVQCVYRGTITPTQGQGVAAQKVAMHKAMLTLRAKPFLAK